MQEYIESVFYLKTQGKECLCPIDNQATGNLLYDLTKDLDISAEDED